MISPNPVQGYADDVQLASREESVIKNMLSKTDSYLDWSGLEVKNTKCAVLYEGRESVVPLKNGYIPNVHNSNTTNTCILDETYTYLGHTINIAGEWKEQVNTILSQFTSRLDLIDSCPLTMKLEDSTL